jgi:hypothetical protein
LDLQVKPDDDFRHADGPKSANLQEGLCFGMNELQPILHQSNRHSIAWPGETVSF